MMKKSFFILLFLAVLSFLATLFPFTVTNSIEDSGKPSKNKVIYTSWPWLPMAQFDKYRPSIDISDEISNDINEESVKGVLDEIINDMK